MRKRILLLDADPATRTTLARSLALLGHEGLIATDGAAALEQLAKGDLDACIVDLHDPASDGFALLSAARTRRPAIPVLVMTTQGLVKQAVTALRAGASEFVSKPIEEGVLEPLLARVLSEKTEPVRGQRTQRFALIGEHPAMRLVLERIEQVADTDANVLIRGETGTGKEVVARLIHATSTRRAGPFVAVNMAAIPEALAESELLGHTEGAFTGADRSRTGRIQAAQDGTLFLDEIGDMPLNLQGKILRVLQEREVTPIGGNRAIPVDVRVIAATHRNLEQMVRDGQFREDLYYRLDVIPIEVPPLRDRRDDIRLLADHFRGEFNLRDGGTVPPFSPEVMHRLCSYDWPGNVRQLENTIERLVIVARSRPVTVDDLPTNLRTDVVNLNAGLLDLPPSGVDLRMLLAQLEDRLIGQALARTGGNKNRAAELLGLNRTTLVEKLRRRNVA